jgi:hypothetical protein
LGVGADANFKFVSGFRFPAQGTLYRIVDGLIEGFTVEGSPEHKKEVSLS